jgi:abequosyltransferase
MTLLTIAIPTYNRADALKRLLQSLQIELDGLEGIVQVMVSDNASTDATPQVLAEMRTRWPALKTRSNPQNIGPEANFCECLDRIESRYFWLLGDDDMPKAGVIGRLLALLESEFPDLLYMQSEWVNPLIGPTQGTPVATLHFKSLSQVEFARDVHVWCTFISGMVVNRETLLAVLALNGGTLRQHSGTSLVQLGWVFPLLRSGNRFLFVFDQCVLATKDNTGGYALLTVFGSNFSRIARDAFRDRPPIASLLISRTMSHYLPGLIWGARSKGGTRFVQEDPWPELRKQLGMKPLFWLLLLPLGRFPRLAAQPFYQAWRVFSRLGREYDRLRRALHQDRAPKR